MNTHSSIIFYHVCVCSMCVLNFTLEFLGFFHVLIKNKMNIFVCKDFYYGLFIMQVGRCKYLKSFTMGFPACFPKVL